MYTLIIIFIVVTGLSLWCFIKEFGLDVLIILLGTLIGLLGTAICFLILLVLSATVLDTPKNTVTTHKVIEIKKLNDDVTTQGAFFILAGNTNDKLEYRYLAEDEDGLLEYHTVDASDVKINYKDISNEETPYFDVYTTEFKPVLKKMDSTC